MANLKELSKRKQLITGGHRGCAGCGALIAARQVLLACKNPVVVSCATGCLEVTTSIFPYTAWRSSFFHSAFENSAATIAGVEIAYKALKKRGKINTRFDFIGFGGDGGTYDIGFQALSGAMERGHNILYVCYNNEAYMNTGIQRSSATPLGASTTTEPAGKVRPGKITPRKDLTSIMVSHNIPYVAQASIGYWNDLIKKVEKALSIEGATFLNILAPCRLGWGFNEDDTIEIAKMAVAANVWPLYEVENQKYRITYRPKEKIPMEEFLKPQRRFAHLFKGNRYDIIQQLQEQADREWERLNKLEEITKE